mgnify:CR=1 FL=1
MAKEKLTNSNLLNLTSKPTTYKTKTKLAHMYKADDSLMSADEVPISNNIVDVIEELSGELNKLHDDVHHMYKMIYNAFGSAESEQWASQGAKGDTGSAGAKGDTGASGSNGTNGTNGSAGAKGDKGDTGSQGATGATGATGAAGSDAAVSGYDSAVVLVYNSKGQTKTLTFKSGLLKSVK